jgi:prepilin-type N-terminal cleavage/methylation domain-containing protein
MKRTRQAGFSLIELMVAILILMVLMGAVFSQLDNVQKRARSEEVKLDMFQTAREFIDQMVRDIHQAGFPNGKLYPDMVGAPPNYDLYATDPRNAVGIYHIDPREIRFQGDIDGDGFVDVVAYKLFAQSGTPGDQNCPCLRRAFMSSNPAIPPNPPAGQPASAVDLTNQFKTQVENIRVISNNPTDISNTVVFIPYDKTGGPVDLSLFGGQLDKFNYNPKDDGSTPLSGGGVPDPINRIWSVRILLTVQGQVGDIGTAQRPTAFLTATAQVNN